MSADKANYAIFYCLLMITAAMYGGCASNQDGIIGKWKLEDFSYVDSTSLVGNVALALGSTMSHGTMSSFDKEGNYLLYSPKNELISKGTYRFNKDSLSTTVDSKTTLYTVNIQKDTAFLTTVLAPKATAKLSRIQ